MAELSLGVATYHGQVVAERQVFLLLFLATQHPNGLSEHRLVQVEG